MPYTISDLKKAVSRRLHGTTANQLTDFYGLLYDVACKCQEDCDFEETRRSVQLITPIYGQAVFDYACPSDLKGNRIIDLRPQADRKIGDILKKVSSQDFDLTKTSVLSGSELEVRWNTYIKTLRISVPALSNIMVNDCNGVDTNGLWVSGPGANNAISDKFYFVTGSGSIKYSIGTNNYIENITMSPVDLSIYEKRGVIFCWAYVTSNYPTSYILRWGTDTISNYWEKTVTSRWDGTAFVKGWNLLGFDWSTANKIGNPISSAINSVRFITNLVGTDDPVYFDGLVCSLGSIYEIEYYSKYLFRDASGAFKERATSDSDMLNLDTDSYGVFLNCLAWFAAQQQQGRDGSFDISMFENAYLASVSSYNRRFPSQAKKTIGSYFNVKNSSYAAKLGGVALRP